VVNALSTRNAAQWAAFLCGYPLLPYFLPTKTHNATPFYRRCASQ
jgi:hypothetical protein